MGIGKFIPIHLTIPSFVFNFRQEDILARNDETDNDHPIVRNNCIQIDHFTLKSAENA